ncbi:MAG TPA: hypothetical protein VHZ49_08405 [Methylomirabilota bacterium]|jgi:hypothetical protein|nr:hypothetical protein [Methylomirabilota bacterium]
MIRGHRTIGALVVLLLAAVVTVAQAQPQFNGTWVLDRAQSQLPARGPHGHGAADPNTPPPQVKLTVEQQGNTLKATRTMVRGSRERAVSETYVTDGSERTETMHRGSSVTKATLGGDRLVVQQTHTMPPKQEGQAAKTFSRESVWTLSPDGRTLTIDTTMHSDRGDRTMKSVYTRSS